VVLIAVLYYNMWCVVFLPEF